MKQKHMKNNLIKNKEMPESELCPGTVPAAAWSNYLPSHIKALIGKNKGHQNPGGAAEIDLPGLSPPEVV